MNRKTVQDILARFAKNMEQIEDQLYADVVDVFGIDLINRDQAEGAFDLLEDAYAELKDKLEDEIEK